LLIIPLNILTGTAVVVIMIVWKLSLLHVLPMQSVPISTNVVSLNPAQPRCTWYNIMW